VGFLVGLGIFMLLSWRMLSRSQAFGLLGVALASLAIVGFAGHELAQSLGSRVGDTSTIYGRIATWIVAIQSGLKAPILGIGLNNLREVLVTHSVQFQGVANFPRIHNSFLAILAEQGLVGLVLYLTMVASIVRPALRITQRTLLPQDRWRGITVISIIAAYLLPAMFASTIHEPYVLTHFFVYAVCGAVAGRYSGLRLRTSFASRHSTSAKSYPEPVSRVCGMISPIHRVTRSQ
jgi:O-antigen ligase